MLKFNDACKLLLLNNIDGLTSRMMIELFTSEKLKRNTHSICTGVCVSMKVAHALTLSLARRYVAQA